MGSLEARRSVMLRQLRMVTIRTLMRKAGQKPSSPGLPQTLVSHLLR